MIYDFKFKFIISHKETKAGKKIYHESTKTGKYEKDIFISYFQSFVFFMIT